MWFRDHGRAAVRARKSAARIALVAVVLLAFGVAASTAGATGIRIVTQGTIPSGHQPFIYSHNDVWYYPTIQEAINASHPGDWVLIEPGTYKEEVKVARPHSRIWIRGMDRNGVIVDGTGINNPAGANGIEVYKDNNVYIENLTVRNFERASLNGPGGNEIWWNGGEGSGRVGPHGWWGKYLTAYDTGLDGGYGIFTNNESEGEWENIYASGFNDSGIYLGACAECDARINKATMEYNALGYSGSNSGGNLIIENSIFNHNTAGIAPNSENPGDGPPPQNGACEHIPPYKPHHKVLPEIKTTEIAHCTIFRYNKVEENNDLSLPANSSAAAAPWGVGIELPGVYGDLVEHNEIKNNPTNGVLGFEYPNPFPPQEDTIYFQFQGNKVANNTFSNNGYLHKAYSNDIGFFGGLFGSQTSVNDCASGNTLPDGTFPENLEGTWGCQNSTTPNPDEAGFSGVEYLLELQAESENRPNIEPVAAPPAQPTMPNKCENVPANPLCP